MPTFILGAGFNVDAASEAGPTHSEGYPLVGDLARDCFDLAAIPQGTSIENLFEDALARRTYAPIEKLAHRLREADYYIASQLASDSANCYRRFFESFVGSHFLTFNYDSLPETILFRSNRWYPRDGYGLEVDADLPSSGKGFESKKSSTLVLHLHGTLCIRTVESQIRRNSANGVGWLTLLPQPKFKFDPGSITCNFAPFGRHVGADDVMDRIIAPIPNKAEGLKSAFICDTYRKAIELVRCSDHVVAIGYSFNPHDRTSYEPLLQVLSEPKTKNLLIIAPEANGIATSLQRSFPLLSVNAIPATFKHWVDSSFIGLNSTT